MNIFGASEIVELGIQIEKNGRDFYKAFLDRSKEEKSKEIFRYLAGEEEKHIAVFQGILDSVHKYEPAEAYPGEYFSYMNALAADHVFTQKDKGKEMAGKVKNDKEALDLAIGFEKDSILFYVGTKRVVPQSDHQILDKLIMEEQGHLEKLSGLKRKL